jgi:ubiquinone/menaquinone biosynthesis C-methylase UbiE
VDQIKSNCHAEQSGWQLSGTGPEAYERYIVPAWMGEWAQALANVAGVEKGQRVLDLACGTGVVARKAARLVGPSGKVVGLDVNEGMLHMARQLAEQKGIAGIDWRQGEASDIPFSERAFDVVLCQQGLQYFPDRQTALREMARVLVPGGQLALSVWRSLARYPFFMAMVKAIDRYIGNGATDSFHAACSLADRDELRSLINNAGFRNIRIRLEVKVVRFPSLEEFIPGYLAATPITADIAAMKDADRAGMVLDVIDSLREYTDDGGLAAPMECHVVTAER